MGAFTGWKCVGCGKPKSGFWENEYQMPCWDCRTAQHEKDEESRLKAAVTCGKIKPEQLTELGRKVCGLPPTTKAKENSNGNK